MLLQLFLSFIVMQIHTRMAVLGCDETETSFGYEQEAVTLYFGVNITHASLLAYQIGFKDSNILSVLYQNGVLIINITVDGIELIGDASVGNLSIRIPSMDTNNVGLYTLRIDSPPDAITCIELSMRARPNPPQISNTVTTGNGNKTVAGVEGKDTSLICTSTGGYPKPYMAWYKTYNQTALVDNSNDPERVDRTYTLSYTFGPARSDDGKLFICQTSFDPPEPLFMSDQAIMYLSLRPSTPDITLLGPLIESQTQTEIATCTSGGFRPASVQVSWNLDGSLSTPTVSPSNNNGIYSFSSQYTTQVGRSNNGKQLKCVVNHTTLDSPLENSAVLDVYFKPLTAELAGITDNIVANNINRLSITCTSGTSNPMAIITWYKNGKVFVNTAKTTHSDGQYYGTVTSQSWEIVATRDMDADELQCSVHNSIDNNGKVNSIKKNLNLLFHPIAYIQGGNTIEEGHNKTLMCSVHSKPTSIVSWYHNDSPLRSDSPVPTNVHEYTIVAVHRSQAGRYKCNAANGHQPNGESELNLVVTYAPDVIVTTTNVTVNDTEAELRCIPSGVPATYTYSGWQHEWPGYGLVREALGINPTLRLSSLTYEHSGIYKCSVTNGVNSSLNPNAGLGHTYLQVQTYPVVLTPDRIMVPARLNNVTIIAISFYSNVINNTAECFRNQRTLDCPATMTETNIMLPIFRKSIQTKGTVANLQLTITDMAMFGEYIVRITNVIGSSRAVIVDVVQEGPPEVPTHISVVETGATSVTLSWIPGFHGGYDQTFIIEYSEYSNSWNPNDKVEKPGGKLDVRMNKTVDNLQAGTTYFLRMKSMNRIGDSQLTETLHITTISEQGTEHIAEFPSAAVGGTVGSIFGLVIILILVVVIVLQRKKIKRFSDAAQDKESSQPSGETHKDGPEYSTLDVGGQESSDHHGYYNLERNTYEALQPDTQNTQEYGTLNISETEPPSGKTYENIRLSPMK